jgi:chaperonin cofactor prefoldin
VTTRKQLPKIDYEKANRVLLEYIEDLKGQILVLKRQQGDLMQRCRDLARAVGDLASLVERA